MISFYSFLFLIAAVLAPSLAMAEKNQIDITLRHSKYPYQCFAITCFDTNAVREGRIRNAKQVAENSCSSSSSNTCEKDKEYSAAVEQCENSYCAQARCRTTDVKTGRCVSGAYFSVKELFIRPRSGLTSKGHAKGD